MKKKTKPENSTIPSHPVGMPLHRNRFDKTIWESRNLSNLGDIYISRLNEIIEKGYEILTKQIAGGAIVVDNEASFQLQFAYILKTIGELYKFSSDDLFTIELESKFSFTEGLQKSKSKNARIDVILTLGDSTNYATAAIELKFFKEKNHREPNNRYDVFLDLHNLENYKKGKLFDITLFILGTNHSHYVNQKDYSKLTTCFDFRDGSQYLAGTLLVYETDKPYGNPIKLENNYTFKWDVIEKKFDKTDNSNLYFLKLKV